MRPKLAQLAVFCFALGQAPVTQAEPLPSTIRLGVINDQSGPYAASSGTGTVVAVRMAVEDFGGKVQGRPVEVVAGDNQTKPDVASVIVRRWMSDGFAAVIDGGSSAATLASLPIVRDSDRTFVFTSPASTALTNESCTPNSVQFTYDSYSLAKSLVTPMMAGPGNHTWFFITANYAAGASIQEQMTAFIERGGGKVVGSVKHPIGDADFSSYLVQAQASKADVIALVNFGADLANTLKQANEFGIARGGTSFAIPLIFIDDIKAVGLDRVPRLSTGLSYYWDLNDEARSFARRFAARMNGQYPEETHAGAYSGALHLLKGMEAANSVSGKDIVRKMKELPVNDFYNKDVPIRADGRVMNNFYLSEIKAPAESKAAYDFFTVRSTIRATDAFQSLDQSTCPLVKK